MEYEIDKKLSASLHLPLCVAPGAIYTLAFQVLCAQLLLHADITSRDDVLRMGIDKYNDECRSIVMRHAWGFLPGSCKGSFCKLAHCSKSSSAQLNISRPMQGLNMGCDCLPRYSSEWEKTVRRIGRWIDFQKGYKTLDPSYMESVWWVFSELYKKGLVYRGYKVDYR